MPPKGLDSEMSTRDIAERRDAAPERSLNTPRELYKPKGERPAKRPRKK